MCTTLTINTFRICALTSTQLLHCTIAGQDPIHCYQETRTFQLPYHDSVVPWIEQESRSEANELKTDSKTHVTPEDDAGGVLFKQELPQEGTST